MSSSAAAVPESVTCPWAQDTEIFHIDKDGSIAYFALISVTARASWPPTPPGRQCQCGLAPDDFAECSRVAIRLLLCTSCLVSDFICSGALGEVVRRKAHDIGAQAVSAATDARAVTEIKAKYAMDPSLSMWKISVSCAQGHVTLSGTAAAEEDIGRAVALALEADGVRDVTSTIQVQPGK